MTEERIGFLCNIASNLSPENESHRYLKSYYLMRCNELTRGYGLPMKHFSKETRCPSCCLEWSRKTQVNVLPVPQNNLQNKEKSAKKPSLQRFNKMVQTCSFCKQSTTTLLVKPEKQYIKSKETVKTKQVIIKEINKNNNIINNSQKNESQIKNNKETKKNVNINVYSNAFDVFSLKNDNNTLATSIKTPAKVINNNKKRKDKFAGLCQKAVLASAKLKQQKETKQQTTQNKLNLFLRPSSE